MKKFTTLSLATITSYLNSDVVVSLVAKSIQDKPLFLVKMLPLRDNGLFCYSVSSDEQVSVPCVVVQSRYKLADNYKIELVPTVPGFGKQSYYLMDFAQLLRDGVFQVIDQSAPDIVEPTGFAGLVYRVKERWARERNASNKRESLAGLKNNAVRRFGQLFGRPTSVRF